MPPLSCTRLELTRAAFSAICGIIICSESPPKNFLTHLVLITHCSVFSSFRVYAINRQHWKWAIAVAVLQLANWGINNVRATTLRFDERR